MVPPGRCTAGRAAQQLAEEGDRKGRAARRPPGPRQLQSPWHAAFNGGGTTPFLRAGLPPPSLWHGRSNSSGGQNPDLSCSLLPSHPSPNREGSRTDSWEPPLLPPPQGTWKPASGGRKGSIQRRLPPMHIGLIGEKKTETTVLKLWVTFWLSNNNPCDFLLCCYRTSMQTFDASVFPSRKWVQQSLHYLPHRAAREIK